MVREIKFKGKGLNNGKWFYGGYFRHLSRTPCPIGDQVEEEDYVSYIIDSGFSDWNLPKPIDFTEIIPETVSQCTDMVDNDGVVIWEHDIVTNGRTFGHVVFKNGAFKFNDEYGDWDLYEFNYSNVFKVIGNSIDDPELVE